jgi:hypothetical protein
MVMTGTNGGGYTDYDKREPVFEEDLVTPDRVKVWEDDFKSLCVTIDGKDFKDLRPHRVFPLSGKADYVSFLNGDGKETVMLSRPHALDAESREILEHALGRMYYLATITSVYKITEKMGVGQWEVQTDRGYAHFEVVDRQLIRRMPGGRLVITDADGNRFEIRDVEKLDERSRKLIESET